MTHTKPSHSIINKLTKEKPKMNITTESTITFSTDQCCNCSGTGEVGSDDYGWADCPFCDGHKSV